MNFPQRGSHVLRGLSGYRGKKSGELQQGDIAGVVVPGFDVDPVVRLQVEVVGGVVDDDDLRQVSAQSAEVFQVYPFLRLRVLVVQSVRDLPLKVDSVEDPVGVAPLRGREDDQFEVSRHQGYELGDVRPDQKLMALGTLVEVNQGLVQVEDQSERRGRRGSLGQKTFRSKRLNDEVWILLPA